MKLNRRVVGGAILAVVSAFGMAAGSAGAAFVTNGPLAVTAGASPSASKLLIAPSGSAAIPIRCASSGATFNLLPSDPNPSAVVYGTGFVPTFSGCLASGVIPVTVNCSWGSAYLRAWPPTIGGVTWTEIRSLDCTYTVSASCTARLSGVVDGSYDNIGVLTVSTVQNLSLTASCPSNIFRSGTARLGSDTPGVTPPGALNYNVTSAPIPNVIV